MIAIDPSWVEDREPRAPQEREVRLWAFPLDGAWPRPDLERALAEEERRRADSFHFERDRRRFVLARAMLRVLLARALEIEPAAVQFTYGLRGKPGILGEAPDGLRFNLSHSQDLALCALARGRELGVDVEQVRASVDIVRIARRFFTPAEQTALAALPESAQRDAFFRCWTCKEAYLKAIGQGLFRCSTTFDVAIAPRPAALESVHGEPAEAARWSMRSLTPAAGFVGAVLAEGESWQLTRLRARP